MNWHWNWHFTLLFMAIRRRGSGTSGWGREALNYRSFARKVGHFLCEKANVIYRLLGIVHQTNSQNIKWFLGSHQSFLCYTGRNLGQKTPKSAWCVLTMTLVRIRLQPDKKKEERTQTHKNTVLLGLEVQPWLCLLPQNVAKCCLPFCALHCFHWRQRLELCRDQQLQQWRHRFKTTKSKSPEAVLLMKKRLGKLSRSKSQRNSSLGRNRDLRFKLKWA